MNSAYLADIFEKNK